MSEFMTGPVTVVTGGAEGLGRGIVARLVKQGHRVAVLDRHDQADVPGAPDQVLTFGGDVRDRAFLEATRDGVLATWGRVDGLVNNAGIFPRKSVRTLTDEDWREVLDTNLGGTFLCSQVFGTTMLEAGGAIVNLASGHAFRPFPDSAAYAASKGGIVSFTRALAVEWAPTVRVNCVVPGIADTAMPRLTHTEESLQATADAIPLRRIGTPEDTAATVAFLLSDDASYITGQTLGVNGGALLL